MLNLIIAGPLIGVLALLDIILHIYLDIKKVHTRSGVLKKDSGISIHPCALIAASISTILTFILVCMILLAWILSAPNLILSTFFPLFDSPDSIWMGGLTILAFGIILHGWSRFVRRNMASSWAMSDTHRLVTQGPYSRIRHPSYLSYMLSMFGLFLMIPSIYTLVILIGIPGYYWISMNEENLLLVQFGDEYESYMQRSGRFFPCTGLKKHSRDRTTHNPGNTKTVKSEV
jgi:protein-S-isoprenylcysteine O-methyltransferase Ste14